MTGLIPRQLRVSVALGMGWIVLCLLGTGCGEHHPATIPVSGTVTYQGKPLTGGELTFQPAGKISRELQRPATANIRPDGTYDLSTFRRHDGALPGEYLISIASFENPAPIESIDGGGGGRLSRIPMRYANPATSDLRKSVPSDGSRQVTIDFDLE